MPVVKACVFFVLTFQRVSFGSFDSFKAYFRVFLMNVCMDILNDLGTLWQPKEYFCWTTTTTGATLFNCFTLML